MKYPSLELSIEATKAKIDLLNRNIRNTHLNFGFNAFEYQRQNIMYFDTFAYDEKADMILNGLHINNKLSNYFVCLPPGAKIVYFKIDIDVVILRYIIELSTGKVIFCFENKTDTKIDASMSAAKNSYLIDEIKLCGKYHKDEEHFINIPIELSRVSAYETKTEYGTEPILEFDLDEKGIIEHRIFSNVGDDKVDVEKYIRSNLFKKYNESNFFKNTKCEWQLSSEKHISVDLRRKFDVNKPDFVSTSYNKFSCFEDELDNNFIKHNLFDDCPDEEKYAYLECGAVYQLVNTFIGNQGDTGYVFNILDEKTESYYWYFGDFVARKSNHWGKVGSCLWVFSDEDEYKICEGEEIIAIAYFDNFQYYNKLISRSNNYVENKPKVRRW